MITKKDLDQFKNLDLKTKALFIDFQINGVPMEKIILNYQGENYILLDDVNERRYKVLIKNLHAFRTTDSDYMHTQDFYNEYCFRNGYFQRHIIQIENSKWIAELKEKNVSEVDNLKVANHYILPLYDYVIEIIADNLLLTEYLEQ